MRFYPNTRLLWCFLLIFSNCLYAHNDHEGPGKTENTLTCNVDEHYVKCPVHGNHGPQKNNEFLRVRERHFDPAMLNNINDAGIEPGTIDEWQGVDSANEINSETEFINDSHMIEHNSKCTHGNHGPRDKDQPLRVRERYFDPNMLNNCNNVGFELGTFEGWQGAYGASGAISEIGLVNGRHTIMSGAGMDPITNQIPVVAPGSNYSVRLGNSNDGFEADRLITNFLVTEDNSLFSYKFAVVMEDPGHPQEEQPRFEIAAYDESGELIPCTYYLVIAAPFIEGFESLGSIRYRDWSTVGIDFSNYIGQNISITFTTIDCAQGGHFGYAYIDAECLVAELTIDCNDPDVCGDGAAYCPDANSVILTAPEGFVNYQWNTGDAGRVITVNNPEPGTEYSVSFNNFTSVTEDTCTITLSIVLPDPPPIDLMLEEFRKDL